MDGVFGITLTIFADPPRIFSMAPMLTPAAIDAIIASGDAEPMMELRSGTTASGLTAMIITSDLRASSSGDGEAAMPVFRDIAAALPASISRTPANKA